jgi:ABC-type spermidine/putrescine transport system permease subunit I
MNNSSFFKVVPALLWQLLFFYVPLTFVFVLSFSDSHHLLYTLKNYLALWDSAYLLIMLRSLLLAFITASLCLSVGYPLAYYIALKKRSFKNVFLFFVILPFWTNLLVLTYAWFFILDRDGLLNNLLMNLGLIHEPIALINNFFSIILVMFYCYLPFMIMPLFSVLEKFDTQLIEASKDLGANQFQTLWHVIVPITLPGIKAGFLLVFVPAFAEFVIPLLVGGDKYMFVGTVISHYFLIGQDKYMGSAFTVVSSCILFATVFLISLIIGKAFPVGKKEAE